MSSINDYIRSGANAMNQAAAHAGALGLASPWIAATRKPCPYDAGTPAAIIWQQMQSHLEEVEYCERQMKEYAARLDAAKRSAEAMQSAIDKLVPPAQRKAKA